MFAIFCWKSFQQLCSLIRSFDLSYLYSISSHVGVSSAKPIHFSNDISIVHRTAHETAAIALLVIPELITVEMTVEPLPAQ
jgi:hypothetical protein